MQRNYTRTILLISLIPVLLAVASISAFARVKGVNADVVRVGQLAPSFSVRTLQGVTYNNASLNAGPTLLQFWTTQCRGCRDDQAAVDEVDSKFAGQGLVVLAIDAGESAAAVQKYLRDNPRTVRVVLDEQKQVARRFGQHGNPYYVMIDRQGRIAATHRGAAGEQGLISLLKRAGMQERQPVRAQTPQARILEVAQGATKDVTPGAVQEQNKNIRQDETQGATQGTNQGATKPEEQNAADQKQAGQGNQAENDKQAAEGKKTGEPAAAEQARPKPPSGMKVIEIAPEKNSRAGQPPPKAVFVLTNGERLETDHYTMDPQFLHLALEGGERVISMREVDVQATESANRARGNDLKIPTSKSEVFVSF